MTIEGTMDFNSTTQYLAYASTQERKIRVYMPGSDVDRLVARDAQVPDHRLLRLLR